MSSTALLWLRRDLRLHDHPALTAACAAAAVVPVFCLDPRLLEGRHRSGPRIRFLLGCLHALDQSLRALGSHLVVRTGPPEVELPRLARTLGATAVHATADVGPFSRRRDDATARALAAAGAETTWHPGLFVVDDPVTLRANHGGPYTVFTPFYRAWLGAPRRAALPAPSALPAPPPGHAGRIPRLGELDPDPDPRVTRLAPDPRATGSMHPGEPAARQAMTRFLSGALSAYARDAQRLDAPATSRLSAHLHFGCLSVRELEHRLTQGDGADAFRRQLCWRDFYAQLLWHFPDNTRREHQPRYRATIRWRSDRRQFDAWRDGRTGFPLVDAAMRQLRHEGWMPGRARLVVGSFLTKDLGIDWRWGERWFMRTLIDGDEANNNGNWQWIASVGVDPQPAYRRIYNPARQRARFDPEGAYVRRHVPELRDVPDRYLDEPWTMPEEVQRSVGCVIGRDYPAPVVDHASARREALARYAAAPARATSPPAGQVPAWDAGEI